MAMNRSVFGATTIFVAGPAIAVMADVAAVTTPVALARTVTAPAMVPRVTCVDASPEASVVADTGATVPPPVAVKETRTPDTASPVASTTLTAKVPAEELTAAVAVGALVMSTRAAGPALGPDPPDESDPQLAEASSSAASDAESETRVRDIIVYAR